jgi:hypothetical protein
VKAFAFDSPEPQAMTPKTPSDPDIAAAARKAATATGKSPRTPKTAAKVGGAATAKPTSARSVPAKSPKVTAAKKAAAPKKPATSPTRKVADAAPSPPARSPAAAPARTSLPNLAPDEREARIRLLAYSYYEARNGADGSAIEDWLRAEAAVAQEIARALQSWAGD